MDKNKKMISLHEQKFLDLDAFQENTSARLKNIEAQVGYFSRKIFLGSLIVILQQIPMNAWILL